jgi:hypothetical protein
MSKPIDHLTLTGRYAGQPYCGNARKEGEVYAHLPPVEEPIDWTRRKVRCAACLAVLVEVAQ